MQDDAYLIAGDGWIEAARPRQIIEEKGKKSKEKPDFTLGKLKFKAELIPPALIIARYFAAEQAEIDKLESEVAVLSQEMEEMAEEHGGDEGLLADAKNDKDKITKASAAARLKAIKNDPDAGDERKLLTEYLALAEKESAASDKLSEAQEALSKAVAAKYGKLTEDEIKVLVVEDKVGEYVGRLSRLLGITDVDLHVEELTGADKTLDVVVDIFNQVNSGGTKLSKGDLALAKICADWPEARDTMKTQLKEWAKAGLWKVT